MDFIGCDQVALEILTKNYNIEELTQRLHTIYMNGYSEALRSQQVEDK
jgi:hypothetical protein